MTQPTIAITRSPPPTLAQSGFQPTASGGVTAPLSFRLKWPARNWKRPTRPQSIRCLPSNLAGVRFFGWLIEIPEGITVNG